jgi:large subunit ribosomal protein L21
MGYAIISLGGKQYRVREGERLLVDRLPTGEGETFTPRVLLAGGDGETQLTPDGVTVTARVVGHVLGEKIRIGKYRPKSGYRRHTGHRSRLSQIEIESIGSGDRKRAARAPVPPAQEAPAEAPSEDAEAPAESAEARETPQAPEGYEGLKVAQVPVWAQEQDQETLEQALAYEQAGAARKGAVAALETAILALEEG